jgi:hypothetical protein
VRLEPQHQKRTVALNCIRLIMSAMFVICPAVDESTWVFGPAKFVWLNALNASHCSSNRVLSVIAKDFMSDRSTRNSPGFRRMFRPEFPNTYSGGTANAKGLNH